MLKNKHVTYFKSLKAYQQHNIKSFNRLRKHKDLSQTEKKLHQARYYLLQRKWTKAKIVLETIANESNSFLQGEKNILLAYILDKMNQTREASKKNLMAIKFFESVSYNKGLFMAHNNQIVYYELQSQYKKCEPHIAKIKELAKDKNDKFTVYRFLATYNTRLNRHKEAVHFCKLASKYSLTINEREKSIFYTVAATIYFYAGNYKISREYLNLVKTRKTNPDRSRVHLELAFLDVLEKDLQLKAASMKIKSSQLNTLKWNIIQQLQQGEFTAAKKLWSRLERQHPEFYRENFKCLNEFEKKSLFMTLVQKYTAIKKQSTEFQHQKLSKKQKQLFDLLSQSNSSISTHELICNIWQEDYETKHKARLHKLMQELKAKLINCEIIFRNNGYHLLEK